MARSRRLGTRDNFGRYFNFVRGVVGGVSDYMLKPEHVRFSDNLIGTRPLRAMGRTRGGTREPQNSPMPDEPISGAKFVPRSSAARRLLIQTKTTGLPGTGKVIAVESGTIGYISVATPTSPTYTVTERPWSFAHLNNTLYATQPGDTQLPVQYQRYGGNYVLDHMTLVAPTGAPTVAVVASGAGVTVGDHYYRFRNRYRNGASLPSPVSAVATTTGPNQQVNITVLPTAGGQDWLGWTLERTKVGAPVSGGAPTAGANWYFVADGTANNYSDLNPDSELRQVIDSGLFAGPQHMEGLVAHVNRLFGWNGIHLYVSQAVIDKHGTGPCNWDPELDFPVGGDDGDVIRAVVRQADRLLIWKSRSVWAFEGFSTDNFQLSRLADGAGAVGPKAVDTVGNICYALGETGFNIVDGDTVNPGKQQFGEVEVSHYLDTMNPNFRAGAVMKNIAGERLWLCYPGENSIYNDEVVEFDFQAKQFRHHTDIRAVDLIVQEDAAVDFGGATLLILDPEPIQPSTLTVQAQPSFLCWDDERGAVRQTYAQSLDNLGAVRWAADGIAVSASTGPTANPVASITATENGGCIIACSQLTGTNSDMFVRGYNAAGTNLWTLRVDNVNTNSTMVTVISDGASGCYVAWREGITLNLQRVTSAGAVFGAWPAGGVVVCAIEQPVTSNLIQLWLGTDGSIFVSWISNNGASNRHRISRHTPTVGAVFGGAWVANGIAFGGNINAPAQHSIPAFANDTWFLHVESTGIVVRRISAAGASSFVSAILNDVAATGFTQGRMISDGAGGAIVTWVEQNATGWRYKCQHITATNTLMFETGGRVLTGYGDFTNESLMVQDGLGGAILVYVEGLAGFKNVKALAFDQFGILRWIGPANLCSALGDQTGLKVSTDGGGGAIVSWNDARAGVGAEDIFAQRVTYAGVVQWGVGGNIVTTATAPQTMESMAFTAGLEGEFPPNLTPRYHLWMWPFGATDNVLFDGSGGNAMPIFAETPWLDDGEPDTLKDLERIQFLLEGGDNIPTAIITTDLGEGLTSVQSVALALDQSGATLGDETAIIDSDDLVIADEDGTNGSGAQTLGLAGDSSLVPFKGLESGTMGYRYKIGVRMDASAPATLFGFVIDGLLKPERRLSQNA